MKILITGGAGFIGSNVVDLYLDAGHEVVVVDDLSTGTERNLNPQAVFYKLDIRSPELQDLLDQEKPDCVNHHAAQASVSVSVKDPLKDAKINLLGLINLLEGSARNEVSKVIFASSGGCVYGEVEGSPPKEETPLGASSPYGVSKIASEYYLQYYRQQYGLSYTVLRYANVYGPRQDPYGEAGVVAIFINTILSGRRPTINAARTIGDAGCTRDFVYVGDVARANLAALNTGDNEAINIGSGTETTIQHLYDLIAEEMGFAQKPRYGPPRPGDLFRNVLSYDKAEKILDWKPTADLRMGLGETVRYFATLKPPN